MEIIKYTRTSFERQILESVCIQQNTHHHILNSRSEYNRCSVPRLSTRLGDKEYKKYEKKLEEEKLKEEALEKRIREMRKDRNKNRKTRTQQTNPPAKRRKMSDKTFTRINSSWVTESELQEVECDGSMTEKRKEKLKNPAPKRIKLAQEDIRNFLTRNTVELLPQPDQESLPIVLHTQQLPPKNTTLVLNAK
jgi:hypothetical protein